MSALGTEPPHVVFVSRVSPMHSTGGMETIAWDLARALAGGGVRITFLTTRIEGVEERFARDGVEVIALRRAPPGRYTGAWWRASRAAFTAQLAATSTAVLSVSAGAYGLLPIRPRLPGIRFVLQAHGTSLGEAASKWRSGRPLGIAAALRNLVWLGRDLAAYPRFDAVVAVGGAVYRALLAPPMAWRLPRAGAVLIPNGVDAERFAPDPAARARMRAALGAGAADWIVATASRLHAQKGVHHALKGFACFAAREPAARFVVLGGGPERPALEALARRLDLGGRVVFAGNVERPELADHLRAADAFLFATTRVEGLPLNVLEALAAGLPAVVSKHLEDVVALGPGLLPVDPADPEAVAAALARLHAARGGERGSHLPEAYTVAAMARAYRALLCGAEAGERGESGGA